MKLALQMFIATLFLANTVIQFARRLPSARTGREAP